MLKIYGMTLKTIGPSETILHDIILSSFIQIMGCFLFNAYPSPEPMPIYCPWDRGTHTDVGNDNTWMPTLAPGKSNPIWLQWHRPLLAYEMACHLFHVKSYANQQRILVAVNIYYSYTTGHEFLPWIKSISNELDIICHVFASQLSGYCDDTANGLWRRWKNIKWASEAQDDVWRSSFLASFMYCYVM